MFSSDEAESYLTKLFVGFVLFCLALVGLGWCGSTVLKPILYPAEQAGVIAERTLNADNVIYNYEWFHRHYTDWQSAGTNAEAKERELNNALSTAGHASEWAGQPCRTSHDCPCWRDSLNPACILGVGI